MYNISTVWLLYTSLFSRGTILLVNVIVEAENPLLCLVLFHLTVPRVNIAGTM